MMTATAELKPLLKRLKLGNLLNTLPERLALARQDQLDYVTFLQILLADEVTRRDNHNLEVHLQKAGFEEICRLEDFDWTSQITVNRRLLHAVFSLDFLARHEHVLFVGPVGVGKSFLAQAIGYAAVRSRYSVRFTRADAFFRTMAQSRVDSLVERPV
jgi:DNA replication protein DnaC